MFFFSYRSKEENRRDTNVPRDEAESKKCSGYGYGALSCGLFLFALKGSHHGHKLYNAVPRFWMCCDAVDSVQRIKDIIIYNIYIIYIHGTPRHTTRRTRQRN
jgi:hypothetical protein